MLFKLFIVLVKERSQFLNLTFVIILLLITEYSSNSLITIFPQKETA